MMSEGVGDGFLNCAVSDEKYKIPVKDVLYVPTLESNLLSVKKLTKQGNTVKFEGDSCSILKGNKTYAEGKITDDLYQLTCEVTNCAKQDPHQNCIHQWHRRLGHRDPEAVMKLSQEKLADNISIDACSARMKCISCIKGKITRKSFPKKSYYRAKQPLDLIHSDVCGPMSIETPGRKKYFLTFIDDCSRYTVVYLLRYTARMKFQ